MLRPYDVMMYTPNRLLYLKKEAHTHMQHTDLIMPYDDDKPKEECGVFGIYARSRDVARLAFFLRCMPSNIAGKKARGSTHDGQVAYIHKGMGLV